jgi:hypothetical protein
MNKEKVAAKLLISLYLIKSTNRLNLDVIKRLRNLIMCCDGLKMDAQSTTVLLITKFLCE